MDRVQFMVLPYTGGVLSILYGGQGGTGGVAVCISCTGKGVQEQAVPMEEEA